MGTNYSGNIIPGYMANYIPKQQAKKVKGLKAAQSIMMDKDSSICILDEDEPIMYFCYTDSFGNLTVDSYDISPHQSEEEKQTAQILSALQLMNQRLEKLEARLNESDTCEDGQNENESFRSIETGQSNNKSKGNGGRGPK